MGARLPDGRYMDDRGKVHRNYNDAKAEAKTLRARANTEQLLARAQEQYQVANDQAARDQRNKGLLGWIPGAGWAYDRSLEQQLNDKAYAAEAVRARQGQMEIYRQRMGEGGSLPTYAPEPSTEVLSALSSEDVSRGGRTWQAHVSPASQARESEARRMHQQYASKEYWSTEEGKALQALAMQDKVPSKDLSSFYQAQRAVGGANVDEVIAAQGYTGDMAEWARRHPDLALREYIKDHPSGYSNDPQLGALPVNYEENVSSWEKEGKQFDQGVMQFRDLKKYPMAGSTEVTVTAPSAGPNNDANRQQLQGVQPVGQQAAAGRGNPWVRVYRNGGN